MAAGAGDIKLLAMLKIGCNRRDDAHHSKQNATGDGDTQTSHHSPLLLNRSAIGFSDSIRKADDEIIPIGHFHRR